MDKIYIVKQQLIMSQRTRCMHFFLCSTDFIEHLTVSQN